MTEALELLREGVEIKAIEKRGQGLRHADGADHAVRRRRHRHLLPRRHGDARSVSRRGSSSRRFWMRWSRPAASARRPASASSPTTAREDKARPTRRWPTSSVRTSASRKSCPTSRSSTGCSCRWCSKRRGILAEKKVAAPQDVDLGLIFGTGFPPFKGGLLFWADTIGAAEDRRAAEAVCRIGRALPADADADGDGRQQPRAFTTMSAKQNGRRVTCVRDLAESHVR